METPKINFETPQEEVFLPESHRGISNALNIVDHFLDLKKPHESPKESIARVLSCYDLPKSDYGKVAEEALDQLIALDAREAGILREARDKAKKYQQMLKDL